MLIRLIANKVSGWIIPSSVYKTFCYLCRFYYLYVASRTLRRVPTDSSLHGGLECGATPKLTRNPKFSCCNLNCNKMRKIQITLLKKEKAPQKLFNVDKESLEVYAEMMRDRYGKV